MVASAYLVCLPQNSALFMWPFRFTNTIIKTFRSWLLDPQMFCFVIFMIFRELESWWTPDSSLMMESSPSTGPCLTSLVMSSGGHVDLTGRKARRNTNSKSQKTNCQGLNSLQPLISQRKRIYSILLQMNQLGSFLSLRKGNKSTKFWFWLASFAPFLFIYLHIFTYICNFVNLWRKCVSLTGK